MSRKRSIVGGVSQLKRAKNNLFDTEHQFFVILRSCGLTYCPDNESFHLHKDSVAFTNSLSSYLANHEDDVTIITQYLATLCKTDELLVKLISPIRSSDSTIGYSMEVSVFRLLLEDPILYQPITEIIVELIYSLSNRIPNLSVDIDLPSLLLRQLRWLSASTGFCEFTLDKLLDLIDACNDQIRRDIILILPDILFKDSQAIKTVERLKQLLLTTTELAPCILETLSNLYVPQDSLFEIQDIALNLLQSTEIKATPVIMKFLLQTLDKQRRNAVITELRSGLDFSAYTIRSGNQVGASSSTYDADESLDLIVADILRTSFLFQKELVNDWIKMLETFDKPDKHNFSDFIVLIIFLSISNTSKLILNLFKNKIRIDCLNETVVQNFFTNHQQVAQRYFNSILQLCEFLLSAKEAKLNAFGSLVLMSSFCNMECSYQQQLIVLLVTLINMKSTSEADTALQTLLAITVADPDKASIFEVFITGLIDGIEQMSTRQIRWLYSILSCMAFRSSKKLNIQSELIILIKKQLSNPQPMFKCIGVMGAITAIEYLMSSPYIDISGLSSCSQFASIASQTMPSTSSSSNHITNSSLKTVMHLLQLIRFNYTKTPEVGSLYMDELGRSIARGTMDSQVEEWVSDKILQNFQDDFVCGKSEVESHLTQFDRDEFSACEVVVNIGPLWAEFNKQGQKSRDSKAIQTKRIVSPACLSPHFRLLVLCEYKKHGDMNEIDALLSCPILLDPESQDPVPTVMTINWIIEIINAFCTQESRELQKRVMLRLKDLVKLRTRLRAQLAKAPNTSLPLAAYEAGVSSIKLSLKIAEKKSKPKLDKKKKPKGKQAKILTDRTQEINNTLEVSTAIVPDSQESQIDSNKNNRTKNLTPGLSASDINLDTIANAFRELDLNVAVVLSFAKLPLDRESDDSSPAVFVSIEQPEIHVLTEDLFHKAHHVFRSATSFGGFSVSKENRLLTAARFRNLDNETQPSVAEKFIGFIPILCKHLETCAEYFKVDPKLNDSNISLSQETSHTQLIDVHSEKGKFHCEIMSNILDVFHLLIKWLIESKDSSTTLLKKALMAFAVRTDSSFKGGYVLLLEKSCQYFGEFVPDKLCHIHAALTLSRILFLLKQNLDDERPSRRSASSSATSADIDIHHITKMLLNREWDDSIDQRGHRYRDSLQQIVNLHFKSAPNQLTFLKTFVENDLTKVNGEEFVNSNNYLQLTKKNFCVFYRQSLECLSIACKSIRGQGTIASERDRQKQFDSWLHCFTMLANLFDMVKDNADRLHLTALLKHGTNIIQTVIKDAMPLLDAMFRTKSNPVILFLKLVQKVTRFMQHVCRHGKAHQDFSLTREIPKTKRCLENFIYRVKLMLSQNQCLQAFWFGNLKNKTLWGEVIESEEEASESQDAIDENNDNDSDQNISELSDGSESS